MDYRSLADSLPWSPGVKLLACDVNGLIAVEKPAGVLSHPNKKGDRGRSLLSGAYDEQEQAYRVAAAESRDERKIYLLNRLDSATSGIVLLALQLEVAHSVLKVFENKQVNKVYTALVFGLPRGGSPIWRDRLSVKRVQGAVRAQSGGGLMAETKLLKAEPLPGMPLITRLALAPLSGRTHQLRIQTSKRGIPIVGDKTYGDFNKNKQIAKARGIKRLCLHCLGTELQYSFAGKTWRFKARSDAPF